MGPGQIEIIRQPVSRAILDEKAKDLFGDMIKAVVDVRRRIMAVGGELHADEERVLLEDRSLQERILAIVQDLVRP